MMKREFRFGKYRILQTLGSGGFAKVYLGEHIYLKTQAAIKVLRSESDLSRQEAESFLKEARTIAQLRHPRIISILDFDVQNGNPYLVMEYAPNGSLNSRYPGRSLLNPKTVLTYIKQVASALQFAHDQRIVHCDVKPENMLLNAKDEILLSDFGIAVAIHSNIKTQGIVGTIHYMAPEQFVGRPVPASDQYGLAVVVYSWLCGQLPFNGKNTMEMYRFHTQVPPRPLREINPQISRELEHIVLTALAKDPNRRFSSIRAFAKALEQAIQPGASVVAPSSSKPGKPATRAHNIAEPQPLLPSLSSFLPSSPSSPDQFHLSSEAENPPGVPLSASEVPTSPSQQVTLQASEVTPTVLPPTIPLASSASPLSNTLQPDGTPIILPTIASPVDEPVVIKAPEEQPIPLSAPLSLGLPLPLIEGSYLTYTNHSGWVSTVAWSPDGTRIASGSWDTTVQIWDAITGTLLFTYRGHVQPVKSVSWSPDGIHIASGSWDNTVQVWDTTSGDILFNKYTHEAQVEAVAWSPDSRYIASAGHDGIVHVWRAINQRTLFNYKGPRGPIWSVAWSPDSLYIAAASHDQTVHIWKALTGELVSIYANHQQQVTVVTWSSDGQYIASGDDNGAVHVWSATNGKTHIRYLDETGTVKALGWSPDSTRLASGVKRLQVRHIAQPFSSVVDFTYEAHTDWVNALMWSPNGCSIASASDDKTVQLWYPNS